MIDALPVIMSVCRDEDAINVLRYFLAAEGCRYADATIDYTINPIATDKAIFAKIALHAVARYATRAEQHKITRDSDAMYGMGSGSTFSTAEQSAAANACAKLVAALHLRVPEPYATAYRQQMLTTNAYSPTAITTASNQTLLTPSDIASPLAIPSVDNNNNSSDRWQELHRQVQASSTTALNNTHSIVANITPADRLPDASRMRHQTKVHRQLSSPSPSPSVSQSMQRQAKFLIHVGQSTPTYNAVFNRFKQDANYEIVSVGAVKSLHPQSGLITVLESTVDPIVARAHSVIVFIEPSLSSDILRLTGICDPDWDTAFKKAIRDSCTHVGEIVRWFAQCFTKKRQPASTCLFSIVLCANQTYCTNQHTHAVCETLRAWVNAYSAEFATLRIRLTFMGLAKKVLSATDLEEAAAIVWSVRDGHI
jgi:hypothetical protein